MRKLTLRLETLTVESFGTTAANPADGTVVAHQPVTRSCEASCIGTACCPSYDSCHFSCDGSTCIGYSCEAATCVGTCATCDDNTCVGTCQC